MKIRDYLAISAWCEDAHRFLADDLSPQIAAMVAATIRLNSGKAAIVEVASDLAEGLSGLPQSLRELANEQLIERHGFGFEYFTRRGQKSLLRIVGRGVLRTEKEHRAALDALSDTTIAPDMRDALETLVLERERQLREH